MNGVQNIMARADEQWCKPKYTERCYNRQETKDRQEMPGLEGANERFSRAPLLSMDRFKRRKGLKASSI
jgi:hypothetical protein